MLSSQNGWPVIDTSSSTLLRVFPWVTGRVRVGAAYDLLNYLCTQFDERVEPIDKVSSWGWSMRKIRLGTSYSNHASGTAVDLNAPKHPLGKVGTFSAEQVREIRLILDEMEGSVRWGGDYRFRKDEMHFEVIKSSGQIYAIAQRLSTGLKVTAQLDKATVRELQRWLNSRRRNIRAWPVLKVDGDMGPLTVTALQLATGAIVDGQFGENSARALELFLHQDATKVPGWYPGLIRALQRFLIAQKG